MCAHKDDITEVTVLGMAEEQLEGLDGIRATRVTGYNMDSLSKASWAAQRGCDQQLPFLYCFRDIVLMQQSCGQSRSNRKNVFCWSRFADASGGKET